MQKKEIDYAKLLKIASSKNFSQMANPKEDDTGELWYDASDDGKSQDDIWAGAQAEILILTILGQLNDKQKIVLLYQVLRESGYKLRHEDCAKTLNVSREWYMTILKGVMKKSRKALQNQMK